jgi:3-isopropylmalate/(R)-2-methylmalate dehydratase small subunit
MSSEITVIAGRGIPLVGNDIDTDRIIPARFLRCITFDGLGEAVFQDDRAQLKGQHPFDQPHFQGARILVVNANFGCGSSREHAPQAIARWGIQAIVGESFAEIFFGNGVAMGLPCVTADPTTITQLQAAITQDPQLTVTVDLNSLQIHWGEAQAALALAAGPRQMLTTGTWDACGQLLAQAASIQSVAAQIPYMRWGSAASATLTS